MLEVAVVVVDALVADLPRVRAGDLEGALLLAEQEADGRVRAHEEGDVGAVGERVLGLDAVVDVAVPREDAVESDSVAVGPAGAAPDFSFSFTPDDNATYDVTLAVTDAGGTDMANISLDVAVEVHFT